MTETELREEHRRVQCEIETAVYVGKLEDNQASLLRSIRRYRKAYETEREMHEQTAILREELQAKYDALRAERDALQAWRDKLTCDGEVGVCSWLVRDGGSMSFFHARGSAHEIIFDTLDCEKIRAERDALQAWKDAVPMKAIRSVTDWSDSSEIDAVIDWLVSLGGAA